MEIKNTQWYTKYKLNNSEDLSIRFYHVFKDRPEYQNQFVLKSHHHKTYSILEPKIVKQFIYDGLIPSNGIDIIGKTTDKGYVKIVVSNDTNIEVLLDDNPINQVSAESTPSYWGDNKVFAKDIITTHNINESLLIKQDVDFPHLVDMDNCYTTLDEYTSLLPDYLSATERTQTLQNIRDKELELQSLWNFPYDLSHLKYDLKLTGCTCPKLDNYKRIGHTTDRIINADCPWHGTTAEDHLKLT